MKLLMEHIRGDISKPYLATFLLFFTYLSLSALSTEDLPIHAENAFAMGLWICLSWWLMDDSARRKTTLPMSYGMMAYLFAPFFIPFYIFHSRGLFGFITIGFYILTALVLLASFYLLSCIAH
jgi:hypothetical protein